MSSFEELVESQLATLTLILRILPNFHKLANQKRTATAIRSRLNCLESYWENCQRQHAKLCALADGEAGHLHEYFSTDKFLSINDAVDETRDTLAEFLESLQGSTAPLNFDESHNLSLSRACPVHLPRIDIPRFAGDITKWETFRDLFESLISNRIELTNAQKLHYLKANLTGDASLILSNIQVTDANYLIAWELLRKRYDNPRAIVNAHLQALVDIPSANSNSVDDLKMLRDKTNDIYTALLNLKRPVNQWEDLMIFLTVSKLDKLTRRDWEISLGDGVDIPNFAELDGFLSSRIRALEAIKSSNTISSKSESHRPNKSSIVRAHQVSSRNGRCVACDGNHPTNHCKTFLNLTIDQRVELLKRGKCCFNCMRKGHLPWACKSNNVCTICKKKHHTLIHRDMTMARDELPSTREADSIARNSLTIVTGERDRGDNVISSNNFASRSIDSTLLPTALVILKSGTHRSLRVRALLDQGSQASFVSESVVQLLRVDRKTVSVDVSGIGGTPAGNVKHIASFTMEPCSQEGPVLPIRALILPKLTAYLPKPCSFGKPELWQSLKLADSSPETKEKVELIIGADYYGSILRDGLLHGPNGGPTAQRTIFGWVISAPAPSPSLSGAQHRVTVNHVTAYDSLDETLRRFWELEEVPCRQSLSEDETRCEAHFRDTHSRQSDGRYVIRLPFKTDPPIPIGETEQDVKRIFFSNEARLTRQPEIATAYQTFMKEYKDLHHMEEIPLAELHKRPSVYLPHHAALKATSQTTKVRVVFNASRISSNKTSLNDHLLVGPKLQADLFALILKWRSYRFVYTTDIEKMFRQIRVHSSDADYQRIFWRLDPTSELISYRLLTVTYGIASAPFLANRVLKQLASDEGTKYPQAATVLEHDVYVDDLMFGADNVTALKRIRDQVTQLLMAGGFRTHKWASNDSRLLDDIPSAEHGLAVSKSLGDDSSLQILGISWSPSSDAFKMQVLPEHSATFTKRTFLSLLARLFALLGWVAPVTISAKILLQVLWLRKVTWDEQLPDDLSQRCFEYQAQLLTLSKVSIPRWTGQGCRSLNIQIHGFSDASNAAFAAVVYLRVNSMFGPVRISLLYSKTKVAPLKTQSVPRLELCGAVLLVRAIVFVRNALQLTNVPVYCWTDSSVVLAWLRSVPARWMPFVANRTSEIITALPQATWRYVPTTTNPADCASRGISADSLISHPLWWTGPPWLNSPESEWPVSKSDALTDMEKRGDTSTHATQARSTWNLPDEVSSWPRLLRITAYVRRFIHNSRNPQTRVLHSYLTADEIRTAKNFWIKVIQTHYFGKETHALQGKRPIKSNSSLLSLTPFMDAEGILRVGGRLRFSELNDDAKFPAILPKYRVAELIIWFMHLRSLHGGTQSNLRLLRQQYWVIGARNLVKNCIFNCVTCTRQRASMAYQRMGNLPASRVVPSRPFSNAGVDYAGPFGIRSAKGRGHQTHKAYCVLFICLSTRAIHLEVAADYSTEGFLAAFDRFTARRGLPAVIYSEWDEFLGCQPGIVQENPRDNT